MRNKRRYRAHYRHSGQYSGAGSNEADNEYRGSANRAVVTTRWPDYGMEYDEAEEKPSLPDLQSFIRHAELERRTTQAAEAAWQSAK